MALMIMASIDPDWLTFWVLTTLQILSLPCLPAHRIQRYKMWWSWFNLNFEKRSQTWDGDFWTPTLKKTLFLCNLTCLMLHWRSISPLCWLIKVGRHLEFDHWAAICKAIMRWHSGIYIENCELKLSSILGNVLGKLNFRATLASILPFVQCFCRASIL